jgi:hypothetical protein
LLRATAIVTAAEVSLHLLYGTETFLYALNLVPMLIVIAACGTRTRARGVVILLALTVLVCGGISNAQALVESRRFFGPAQKRSVGITISPPAPPPVLGTAASDRVSPGRMEVTKLHDD